MRCSKHPFSLVGVFNWLFSPSRQPTRRAVVQTLLGGVVLPWPPMESSEGMQSESRLAQPLTLAVAQPHALVHLPVFLANVLGFFQAEGLDVKLVDHVTEEKAVQAVLKGAASVAVCAYSLTFTPQAREVDWQAFLLPLRVPQVVLGTSLKTMGPYRSPADLRGRRVGGLASTPPSHLVVRALLRNARLDPGDVTWVTASGQDELLSRFRAGELDALSVGEPLATLLEQRGEMRVLADTRSVHGTRELLGGLVPGSALCAPSAWVAAHAKQCQALANGVVHALKWLQTAGPADLIKALPDATLGADRALFLAAFEKTRGGFSADGLFSADAVHAAWAVHKRLNALSPETAFSLDRTHTNQFALKAKARFRA